MSYWHHRTFQETGIKSIINFPLIQLAQHFNKQNMEDRLGLALELDDEDAAGSTWELQQSMKPTSPRAEKIQIQIS